MVSVGDCFYLAQSISISGNGKTDLGDDRIPGTVVSITQRGLALVDFGHTRECFRVCDLENAPRASKKRRVRKC